MGVVKEIKGKQIRVNTGNFMARYLSLKKAGDNHKTTPRVGDTLLMIVNDQNNVIEYQVSGEESWQVLVPGSIACVKKWLKHVPISFGD